MDTTIDNMSRNRLDSDVKTCGDILLGVLAK